MPHATSSLVEALSDAVGRAHVLVDPDVVASYCVDWTGRFRGSCACVVRPGSADEVAAVLGVCRAFGAAVVPQGGNTGLVGGGVPRGGEVVLSLVRLRSSGAVDAATLQVSVGAGVTLAALADHARAAGLDVGLDLGARDSATIGGIVATNAGGARALRYGTARARVAGLEAVLAAGGRVSRMGGLLKDNAGFDLPALLIGSEGTLGVITAVRWRLVPMLPARVAALVGVPSVSRAAELLGVLRTRVPSLEAAEFFLDDGLSLVLDHLRVAPPLAGRAAVYVLVECAASSDPMDELAAGLELAGVDDAIVADDAVSRERLWRLREAHTEAIGAAGVPHKIDVGVPLYRLGEFLDRVPAVVEAVAPGARVFLFGHLGDGNVHVNVLGPPDDDESVEEAVLRLVAACGGTISAEHGVGRAKARWLSLVRSDHEIAAMTAVKRGLDPAGVLNPGAVLPAARSAGRPAGTTKSSFASAAYPAPVDPTGERCDAG
jgi:FAD/FMN-containing dehydrogenase